MSGLRANRPEAPSTFAIGPFVDQSRPQHGRRPIVDGFFSRADQEVDLYIIRQAREATELVAHVSR